MEDYLLSVKDAFVDLSGDEGLSLKIVGYVRDCMLLDVLQRLRDSDRIDEVCRGMKDHLDDERVCSVGLKKIHDIWTEMDTHRRRQERQTCSDLVAANGTDVILTSMSNHASAADIQMNGCNLFNMFSRFSYREAWEDVRHTFNDNARGVRTIVAALALHPEDIQVQAAALSILPSLLDRRIDANRLLRLLAEAGAVPLLFSALERHNTDHQVVYGAFFALHWIALQGANGRCRLCRQVMLEYKSGHPEWRRVVEDIALTIPASGSFLPRFIIAMDQV